MEDNSILKVGDKIYYYFFPVDKIGQREGGIVFGEYIVIRESFPFPFDKAKHFLCADLKENDWFITTEDGGLFKEYKIHINRNQPFGSFPMRRGAWGHNEEKVAKIVLTDYLAYAQEKIDKYKQKINHYRQSKKQNEEAVLKHLGTANKNEKKENKREKQ